MPWRESFSVGALMNTRRVSGKGEEDRGEERSSKRGIRTRGNRGGRKLFPRDEPVVAPGPSHSPSA